MNEEEMQKLRTLINDAKKELDILHQKQKEIINRFLAEIEQKRIEEIRKRLQAEKL